MMTISETVFRFANHHRSFLERHFAGFLPRNVEALLQNKQNASNMPQFCSEVGLEICYSRVKAEALCRN